MTCSVVGIKKFENFLLMIRFHDPLTIPVSDGVFVLNEIPNLHPIVIFFLEKMISFVIIPKGFIFYKTKTKGINIKNISS
jgi:hypothetical protein